MITCQFGSVADRRTNVTLWPVENLLVQAGLGVSYLVETGQFEAESTATLALVHIVPKGQDHLQELRQGQTPHHLLGRQFQS